METIKKTEWDVKQAQRDAQKQVDIKNALTSNLNNKKDQLATVEQAQKDAIVARDLLEKATESAREQGKGLLEETATKIVQMVFGSQYEIEIALDVKANVPVANVYFKKKISHNYQLINVDNEGGGLRDVVSLAFFIAVSQIVGKDNGALITLDEPTSAVSVGKAESTAEAISALMDYANRQSLIITHEREYLPNLIDHVYYVEQSADGVSKVSEL